MRWPCGFKSMTPHKYLCSATQTFLPLKSLGSGTLSESPSESAAKRLNNTLARYPRPVMSPRDGWSGPSVLPLWRCARLQTHWRNRRLSQESSSVVECHIATLAQLCFCQQLLLSLWLHNASLLSRTASARREGGSPLKQQETATVGAGLHNSHEATVVAPKWKDAFVLHVNDGHYNNNKILPANCHLATTCSILPQDKISRLIPIQSHVTHETKFKKKELSTDFNFPCSGLLSSPFALVSS